MVHISEILASIRPLQQWGRDPSQTSVELEYDSVNWAAVPEKRMLSEEEIVGWGGSPGSYTTVDTDGFKAFVEYFDPVVSDANAVYITDTGPYIYEFVSDQVPKETLQAEVWGVLATASQQERIKNLRPKQDVLPPELGEIAEFHDDIEAIRSLKEGNDVVCYVELNTDREATELLSELRTQNGITYPKPDRLEIVSDIEPLSEANGKPTTSIRGTADSKRAQCGSDNLAPRDTQCTNGSPCRPGQLQDSDDGSDLSQIVRFAVQQIKKEGEIPVRDLIESVYNTHSRVSASPSQLYTEFLRESLDETSTVELDSEANVWRHSDRCTPEIVPEVRRLELPGAGRRLDQRRTAVQAAYNLIQQERSIPTRQLIEQTYGEYTGGYESPSQLYTECLQQALSELSDRDPELTHNTSANVWEYSATSNQ